MSTGLPALDWLVIAVYLGVVAWIGFRCARDQRSTRDYFLGGRSLPWWAAALSIIATETSAATYVGMPGEAYVGDWSFLQMVFGFVLGRLFLAFFFVHAFYRREIVTVYGLLESRFGNGARVTAASLFLVGRAVGSAVRLYAGCIAINVAAGVPVERAVIVLGVFGTVYTLVGGIRAVVWTDVLLGITFVAGGLLALTWAVTSIHGGISGVLADPRLAESTRVFHWTFDLADSKSFVAGFAGGFALTMATHGTDQDVAQRMLTCRDSLAGSLSIAGSAVLVLPVMTLFLAVGTAIRCLHHASPPAYGVPADPNQVFPLFIVHDLPAVARGLVLAGLLAVTISSFTAVVNALASTAVSDFYLPFRSRCGKTPDERHLLAISRAATLVWGAAIIAIAIAFSGSSESLLKIALKVLTYFYGALLGAFLLAIFTRRGSSSSVAAGMLVSVPAVLLLQVRQYLAVPSEAPEGVRRALDACPARLLELVKSMPVVAWPYWIIAGTAVAFGIGILGRSRAPAA